MRPMFFNGFLLAPDGLYVQVLGVLGYVYGRLYTLQFAASCPLFVRLRYCRKAVDNLCRVM